MDTPPENLAQFADLVERQRLREAFVLFLTHVEDRAFRELRGEELSALDQLAKHILPGLIEHHTIWLVTHPQRLHRMLELLEAALEVGFQPAATLDQIAWLRCLAAIGQAMGGHPECVHEELQLLRNDVPGGPIPPPNGTFRQQVHDLDLPEDPPAAALEGLFEAYTAFLHRVGRHEAANHLAGRIGRLLGLIARDEKRPGVVQALFYRQQQGDSRFIHVSIERLPPAGSGEEEQADILYAGRTQDSIDPVMQEAARAARDAADAWLRRAGYPDGLAGRLVRWELATLTGDVSAPPQAYEGGSLALPLAVAIISAYQDRPVPNDVALTGALDTANVEAGQIRPVDGAAEKVRSAILGGARMIYIPWGNVAQIDERPALQHLVEEHEGRIEHLGQIDDVCAELFPPAGSGQIGDILADMIGNLKDIVRRTGPSEQDLPARPVHRAHRAHVLLCMLLLTGMVFLEGWMVYRAFAATYAPVAAWCRIVAATLVVLVGTAVAFALPAACLRHRKGWSWLAGIAILGACFAVATFLLVGMLPRFTWISFAYNAPPAAGTMKDMFFIWLLAWALATNTLNAVAALEHLVANRQFVTAGDCLTWCSPLEGRMPIRCLNFPWGKGTAAIGTVTVLLLILDVNYYHSLRWGTDATFWQFLLGLFRDILFVVAIGEVLIFFRHAVVKIRHALI